MMPLSLRGDVDLRRVLVLDVGDDGRGYVSWRWCWWWCRRVFKVRLGADVDGDVDVGRRVVGGIAWAVRQHLLR